MTNRRIKFIGNDNISTSAFFPLFIFYGANVTTDISISLIKII